MVVYDKNPWHSIAMGYKFIVSYLCDFPNKSYIQTI